MTKIAYLFSCDWEEERIAGVFWFLVLFSYSSTSSLLFTFNWITVHFEEFILGFYILYNQANVFILVVIITMFQPLCPQAFFRCLPIQSTHGELQTLFLFHCPFQGISCLLFSTTRLSLFHPSPLSLNLIHMIVIVSSIHGLGSTDLELLKTGWVIIEQY